MKSGFVHGASDPIGGHPHSQPVTPADIIATVYHCLGIPANLELYDRLQRPFTLVPWVAPDRRSLGLRGELSMLQKDELRLRDEPAAGALRPIDAGEDSILARAAPAGAHNVTSEATGNKVVAAKRPATVATGKAEPKPSGTTLRPQARFSFTRSVLVPAIVSAGCGMAGAYIYENHGAALKKFGPPLDHGQATVHGPAVTGSKAHSEETSNATSEALREMRTHLDQFSERLTAVRSALNALPEGRASSA